MALRSNLDEKLNRTGPDEEKRYLGKYLGYVRDNLDPEQRGRVKVYLPEVMGEVDAPDRWVGWAESISPGSGYDQGLFMVPTRPEDTPRDEGDSTSPYNQTRVMVEFRDGDPAKPFYSSGGPWIGGEEIENHTPILTDVDRGGDESIAKPNGTASSIKYEASIEDGSLSEGTKVDEPVPSTQAVYPRNTVYKSSGGIVIEMDDTPGAERVKIFHPSGSYFEINQTGTLIQRTTGKKVEFVSDERFSSIRGASTEVYQSTQHLQVDKSSTNIYRDSRLVVTEKSEKRFNKGGLTHQILGGYAVSPASFLVTSTGKVEIIGAAAANFGGDKVSIQGRTTSIMGSETMDVIGFAGGVRLIGAARTPSSKIYDQFRIDPILTSANATLKAVEVVIATPTSVGVDAVQFTTFAVWKKGVDAAIDKIIDAFTKNHTVHEATTF